MMTRVMSDIRELTCSEFSEYLTREGVHEEVIELFSRNRICGETFCDLNEEDLKELLPVVGDSVRIRRLLNEATKVWFYKFALVVNLPFLYSFYIRISVNDHHNHSQRLQIHLCLGMMFHLLKE